MNLSSLVLNNVRKWTDVLPFRQMQNQGLALLLSFMCRNHSASIIYIESCYRAWAAMRVKILNVLHRI